MPKPFDERSAGAILYRLRNNTLEFLLLRSARDGFWGFPKGRVRAGEADPEAAQREITEETAIGDIAVIPGFEQRVQYPVQRNGVTHRKEAVYFLAGPCDERVTLSGEHSAFEWATAEKARERISFGDLKDVLAAADAFLAQRPCGDFTVPRVNFD